MANLSFRHRRLFSHRVLHVQRRVRVPPRSARARLQKGLLEVLGEERVQHGVHGRVGVGQAPGQQHHHDL